MFIDLIKELCYNLSNLPDQGLLMIQRAVELYARVAFTGKLSELTGSLDPTWASRQWSPAWALQMWSSCVMNCFSTYMSPPFHDWTPKATWYRHDRLLKTTTKVILIMYDKPNSASGPSSHLYLARRMRAGVLSAIVFDGKCYEPPDMERGRTASELREASKLFQLVARPDVVESEVRNCKKYSRKCLEKALVVQARDGDNCRPEDATENSTEDVIEPGMMRPKGPGCVGTQEGIGVGSWVILSGLQSAAGSALNGKVALVTGPVTDAGRLPVDVDGLADGKLLKPENMRNLGLDDIGEVLLACMAEADRWPAVKEWMTSIAHLRHLTERPQGWGENIPQ